MIVPMKEVFLVVAQRHRDEALVALRRLGIVHVQALQETPSADVASLESHIQELDRALEILATERAQIEKAKENPACISYEEVIPQEVIALARERDSFRKSLRTIDELMGWFQRWGRISFDDIKALQEKGIHIKLYRISKAQVRLLPRDGRAYQLFQDKDMLGIAHIALSESERLPFSEEPLPPLDYPMASAKKNETERLVDSIERKLKSCHCHYEALQQKRADLMTHLAFYRVRHGMKEEEKFSYLKGFCPVTKIERLTQAAKNEGWGYIAGEPVDPLEVPTLIKTPRWLEMVGPVFDFMGTIPGYNEFDISLPFLAFFSLFFALLIGDGGYGLVFLLITAFLQVRLKKVPQKYFNLMWVLGGATLAWGAVSGTWFGVEKIAQLPFLNALIIERVNSFVDSNQDFMMYLCFCIGVIHLSIAHILNGLRVLNSWMVLSQVGWIAILWSLFFVAGNLVLGRSIPSFTPLLFGIGVTLVAFFSEAQGNIFKRVGVSLGNLPLTVISSFSDIVSYLRLFAVGYASLIMAQTFNGMAGTTGGIMAAFTLFLGHALNITLGLMAVVVHGIRLNMLEFSGHLGMQWSGREYRPFKENG